MNSSNCVAIKLLIYRTPYRTDAPSAYKVNGPVGIRVDIANQVYIKGTCIYADLDKHLIEVEYEMSNFYLLNKALSIKLDYTEELISKLQHPYWTPQLLPNGDHRILRPPSCGILTLYKGKSKARYPGGPSSSELIFHVYPEARDVFKVEHLNYIPSWVQQVTEKKGRKRDVDMLDRLYFQTGSINPVFDEH
jgi:hypothetical protein